MGNPESARTFARVHVLVVDDDAKMRPLYERALSTGQRFLEGAGFETCFHWAGSGGEAVGITRGLVAEKEKVGCALIDFFLEPGQDGIQTMVALWDLDPHVQCTLVTAARDLSGPEVLERIPDRFRNQWEFVAKPFTMLEVTQRVRHSLATWLAVENEQRHAAQNAHLVDLLAGKNLELEERVRRRTATLADQNRELAGKNEELENALRDLAAAQGMLLQQEKMASIGQLAAGIAHELNNPIGFVHSNLGTLQRYCEKIRTVIEAYRARVPEPDAELAGICRAQKIDVVLQDLPNLAAESLEGTNRVRKIVQDLKLFSHAGQEEKLADLNDCLKSTLNIIHNELKYKATVVVELEDLPPVRCVPGQINQVFMNLLVNAGHAIEGAGEIRVRSAASGDGHVEVTIADTGGGIAPEHLERIFEPFFTTKEIGKGTGLGLSIACDIVRKHGGTLTVASEVGRGTTFTMRLPVEHGGGA